MPAQLYRVRRPNVRKIALVKNPASGNRWHMFKSAPEPGEIVVPAGDDWKIAYTVVAEPGKPEMGGQDFDGTLLKDGGGSTIVDVWDENAIREAAHSFVANGGLTTDAHFEDGSKLGAYRESFVAPADYAIEGHPVKAGSWVLGIEPTAEGRQAILKGDITGVSVEGETDRERVIAKAGAEDDCGCEDQAIEQMVVGLVAGALVKAASGRAGAKTLPRSSFVYPDKAPGPGSYRIDDRKHAILALAFAKRQGTQGSYAKVKATVCKRYPDLPACKSS